MAIHQPDFIDKITNILEANNALRNKDARTLKEEFKKRSDLVFEEFLIDENIVSRQDLLKALSTYYQTPAIDIPGELFDHHLVGMFPKDVLLRNNIIPYIRDGDILTFIAANPLDPDLPQILGNYVSYDVELLVGYFRDIQNAIEEFYDTSLTQEPEAQDQDVRQEREEQDIVESMEELK